MTELQSVKLQRQFSISKERLFELLTTPHYMQQWFFPAPDIRMKIIARDFNVGGKYRFHYTMPDGDIHVVVGQYCAIDAPHTLAFTWGWVEPDDHADIETLVTLTLQETDSSTTLSVLHERLPVGDMLDRHEAGWLGTLNNLNSLVLRERENHDRGL